MWIEGLDEKDNELVSLLLRDGRASYSDLGKAVGLSRTAVKNRIAILEENGIISGYKAVINPQAILGMSAFIMNVEVEAEHFASAKQRLSASNEVVTMFETTGRCHLVVICLCNSVKDMRTFVNKSYNEIEGITSVNAHAILDVLKGSIILEN